MIGPSDIINIAKYFQNPLSDVGFSLKILEPNESFPKAELKIYNLSSEPSPVKINIKNVSILFPKSWKQLKKYGWDSSETNIKKLNLHNSWQVIPAYYDKKRFSKVVFKLESQKTCWLEFYHMAGKRSLKVFFKKNRNGNWQYKVGIMNKYHNPAR